MKAKWKKSKNLDPKIILSKIDSIKTISEDKKLSYSGFEYHDAIATLQNMVDFSSAANELNQEHIVSTAVNNIAKESALDKEKVIDEINDIIGNLLTAREHKFHILTSISLASPFPAKLTEIEGCRIRFLNTGYPKKYSTRESIVKSNRHVSDGTPNSYAKVIVSLKAKSEKGAVTKALRVLDLQRAIWGLFSNTRIELWGDEGRPINVIRLGGIHTIHKENGRLATNIYWYEPNFTKAALYIPPKIDCFKDDSKWAINQLEKLSYKNTVKDALLRYVRALDERDHNIVLILLWGALEKLASPLQANGDLVTRRISFLFEENKYHKQVLEHLRDTRNRTVHSGDQSERAKFNCYQLLYYFRKLVIFHLRNAGEFSHLDDANNFLDLPSNKEVLNKRKWLIEKAIKFIS